MVLGDIIKRNAKRYPAKIALVFEGTRLTFKQLNDRVNSLVNTLLDLGVKKGDRVAVLLDNCPQFVELYCAAAKGGLVLVPLNYMLNERQLAYVINNAEANALFFGDNYQATVNSFKAGLKLVKNFVVVGASQPGLLNYDELVSQYPPNEPSVPIDENDLVYLLYTSGTTGLPKGVMYTHRTTVEAVLIWLIEVSLRRSDVSLIINPLFWGPIFLDYVLTPFYLGSSVVLLRKFEPGTVLEAIEREKATVTFAAPSQIVSLLEYPQLNRFNTRSLRSIVVAGAPMPVDVFKRAITAFGKVFEQCYALIEGPNIVFLHSEDWVVEGSPEKLRRLTSCGRESINVEVRVVDEAGKDVSPGEIGEVVAKGDSMMKGYWSLPQVTQETVRGGYLYTGDLATVDDEGYIFLAGRKKDVITSQGKSIYPSDVEEVLYRHPAILEAAVIGVSDEKIGETPVACVVLKEGKKATAEEIMEFCKQSLADYAVPKSVEFMNTLPRTPTGKVLRRELQEKYQSEA